MLAEQLNTNRKTIRQLLTIHLGKGKACGYFVPHQLKQTAENDSDFLDCIITDDETCCCKYDPKTKRQSEQWKSKDELKPQIALSEAKNQDNTDLEGEIANREYYLSLRRLWLRAVRI
ncbi:hypothetical protein Trydic_g11522 [Trypoxylus dichotomus]